MSTYVCDAGSRYIVTEENLPSAQAWLNDRGGEYTANHLPNGSAEIVSTYDGLFCGGVGWGFSSSVWHFIDEFCEPYSYASFRNDDEFEYGLLWKDGEGSVHEEWEDIENPFQNRINSMEDRLLVMGLIDEEEA